MSMFSFLLAAVGPLAIKILAALGISAVTFVGVDTAMQALIAHVTNGYGGLPGSVLLLASLAGMPQALGLVLGAINARLALWLAASATKWVTHV